MPSLCKAIIVGNLGADPEKRFTQDGRAVTRFRVAVNSRKKEQGGEWADHTEWFGVTAFGKQAEMAAERLVKGSRVYVDGRLESRTWDGPEGKRFFMDIIANDVVNLDNAPREERAETEEVAPAGFRTGIRDLDSPQVASDLEDLPF